MHSSGFESDTLKQLIGNGERTVKVQQLVTDDHQLVHSVVMRTRLRRLIPGTADQFVTHIVQPENVRVRIVGGPVVGEMLLHLPVDDELVVTVGREQLFVLRQIVVENLRGEENYLKNALVDCWERVNLPDF